jgi:hypothetical protein
MRIVRLLVIILFALVSVFFGCQQNPTNVGSVGYVKSQDELYNDTAHHYMWITLNTTLDSVTRAVAHRQFEHYQGLRMAEVKKHLIAAGYGEWLKCDSLECEQRRIEDSITNSRKKTRKSKKNYDTPHFKTSGKNSPVIIGGGDVKIQYND